MAIALFATVIIGLVAVLLSLENDSLEKNSLKAKKAEEDRLYKLSVIKNLEEKISYTTDPEKVADEIILSLRNFYNYSTASSMVIKDACIVFKIYAQENIGPEYAEKIEKDMLSSIERLTGKFNYKMDKKIFSEFTDNTVKSSYSSSFMCLLSPTTESWPSFICLQFWKMLIRIWMTYIQLLIFPRRSLRISIKR